MREEREPKPKTLDERLEALTHSLELPAGMQVKTEKEIRKLVRLEGEEDDED